MGPTLGRSAVAIVLGLACFGAARHYRRGDGYELQITEEAARQRPHDGWTQAGVVVTRFTDKVLAPVVLVGMGLVLVGVGIYGLVR